MFLQCVCWDTDPALGADSFDRPFTGVQVSVSGPSSPPAQPTNGSGLVTFEALTPGDYTVTVTKTDFNDVTDDIRTNNALVASDVDVPMLTSPYPVTIHNTTKAVRVMRREAYVHSPSRAPGASHGLECKRKHAKAPGPLGTSRSIAIPILWVWEEPWIMILRDVFWLSFLALMIVGLATGEYGMAAWMGAFWSYLTVVIFGQVPGIIAMVLAFGGFVAAVVDAILKKIANALLPVALQSHPSPFVLATCFAVWTGFTCALIRGRRPKFFNKFLDEVYIGGAVGAVMGVIMFFVFGGSLPPITNFGDVVVFVMLIILLLAWGFVWAGAAALFSHIFRNDNNLEDGLTWQEDFHLPYAGEHYCVQGHRGFISHAVDNADQEYSYDWEYPEGTPILASKEGHVVLTENGETTTEAHDGAAWKTGNNDANWVVVRHFDESVAHYLHIKKDGITQVNPDLMTKLNNDATNPIHVLVGMRLAGAGNVGISMFSHLHFMVDHPGVIGTSPATGKRHPLKFVDSDTARHENRCYSMRLYKSDTPDLGQIVMTPEIPPFKPGGSPTDGARMASAPTSSAGGAPGLPAPPAPPTPPPPAMPPAPAGPAPPGGAPAPPGVPPAPGV